VRQALTLLAACALLAACSSSHAIGNTHVTVDGRRVLVRVPGKAAHAPLLLILHGYGSDAVNEEQRLQLRRPAERAGMIEVLPEGLKDSYGERFWNATPACCAGRGPQTDDSRFLADLIDTVARRYHADRRRIYVTGLSNGGFMAHRMACDHADTVAAIVSFSGAGALPAGDCRPTQPVAVLEVHGTADANILYAGGRAFADYPGARQTVADWARRNHCAAHPVAGGRLHIVERAAADGSDDTKLAPNETSVLRYPGCARGGSAELWTEHGAEHVPQLSPVFGERAVAFLLAHPQPAP
jgi:polyhydroxybutyrate depolymerase